jgi:hypothetical protein
MRQIPLDPDAVAHRAFVLWQRRGCLKGDDLRDWFEAEDELRREALLAPSHDAIIPSQWRLRPEDDTELTAPATTV